MGDETASNTGDIMIHPTRQDFHLIHRLRVRWAEVDIQRIVFNSHYLTYMDIAFTEYWRALAIPYESIPTLLGGDLYVKKSTLEYHDPARLDDHLGIGLKCARIGNSSIVFLGAVFRGDVLLVSAEMVYVFADPATQTSKPVPDTLRDILRTFEAGVSSVECQLGAWVDLGDQARALRQAVFADELRIALGLDYDAADLEATHIVVRNRLGQALATGRLTQEAPGVGRIARVAVHRAMRAAGFGRMAMESLMETATTRGDTRIVLLCQRSAEGFYRNLGFVPVAEPTMEAGVPHIEMAWTAP